jgi:hypothetical protein
MPSWRRICSTESTLISWFIRHASRCGRRDGLGGFRGGVAACLYPTLWIAVA